MSERRPLQIVIVTAFIFLLAAAVRARENWTALTLGVGAIPLVVEVSGYYYGILAAFAFLWPRYPVTGVGLTATALLSNVVLGAWSADDDRYTAISAAIVILVPVVLASVAFRRQTTAEDSPPASSTIT